MTPWTQKSLDLANNYDYLDRLYSVYPVISNIRRNLDQGAITELTSMLTYPSNFKRGDLLRLLLTFDIFPIKDSYVAYLRRDNSAIDRNPDTVSRIESIIINMGVQNVLNEITRPIEANRQMGQHFKNWINSGKFSFNKTNDINVFLGTNSLIVFVGSDSAMLNLSKNIFGYRGSKGIDFIAKKEKNVAIGEAKFLTDFGGHQNAQLNDARNILSGSAFVPCGYNIFPIAILDGVLYIQNTKNYMSNFINNSTDELIMSALLLNSFVVAL